ncbi:MAG TPA: hypothetical protein VFR91_05730 [Dyella sp.]|nr:hypothetical protein [Dyella sp.]
MSEILPPLLPRRYRLAWLLLWFALLGALAWSAAQPHHAVPATAIGARTQRPAHGHGGVEEPAGRRLPGAGAPGETAFRQP